MVFKKLKSLLNEQTLGELLIKTFNGMDTEYELVLEQEYIIEGKKYFVKYAFLKEGQLYRGFSENGLEKNIISFMEEGLTKEEAMVVFLEKNLLESLEITKEDLNNISVVLRKENSTLNLYEKSIIPNYKFYYTIDRKHNKLFLTKELCGDYKIKPKEIIIKNYNDYKKYLEIVGQDEICIISSKIKGGATIFLKKEMKNFWKLYKKITGIDYKDNLLIFFKNDEEIIFGPPEKTNILVNMLLYKDMNSNPFAQHYYQHSIRINYTKKGITEIYPVVIT